MNELAKSLMCIQMRSGVEIWIEADRARNLQNQLEVLTGSRFILFDDRTINTADIVGIFSAQDMADHTRRKNGQWACLQGNWHDRGTKCECPSREETAFAKARSEAINNCGNCTNGFKSTSSGMAECACIIEVKRKFGRLDQQPANNKTNS